MDEINVTQTTQNSGGLCSCNDDGLHDADDGGDLSNPPPCRYNNDLCVYDQNLR